MITKRIALFASLAASFILNSYALSVLWGWFVVPIFHTPALGIVPAGGLALTARHLTEVWPTFVKSLDWKKYDEKEFKDFIINPLVNPLTALAIGWIIHRFI